ncbi:hypothetical protein [Legionella sp. CNM-4043-24]|uniref:hypothetical protein n=1 Tax=Legionella sp. CNM-4043-24 TaxID=3421646 RepID=UPI00403B27AB
MKNLILATCCIASAVCSNVVFSQSISVSKSAFIEWALTYQDNWVDFQNNFPNSAHFVINVNDEFMLNNKLLHSDRVTMLCDGHLSIIDPGKSGSCDLEIQKHLRLMIAPTDYHNGAKGTGLVD